MSQQKFNVPNNIQMTMIQLLEREDVHAMALMGFAQKDGAIEPLLVVAHDMPNQKEFIEEFYSLCDKYLDFKKVREESLNVKS